MEMLLLGLKEALTLDTMLFSLAGVMIGMIIGALPGLGAVVAITICLPFTFGMGELTAMALLLGIFCGSCCGGSLASILINTPGTPQAAATCFDGYPMALEGKAGEAIGWSLASSILGGLLSCIIMICVAPQLANFALRFGPLELFALILMGLTCISSVSGNSLSKGIAAGLLGLLLACVGGTPFSSDMRFTFGVFSLQSGITLIPAIVGFFAISEIIWRAERMRHERRVQFETCRIIMPGIHQWKNRLGVLIKSVLLGTWVGILPGTGTSTAAFLAYGEAKRSSPRRHNMGKGEPDGIIAAESANNAVTGGALVPTLALGIPGDAVTAILLATFVLHGITPGARLMTENANIVYGIFAVLIFCNLFMYPCCKATTHIFRYLLRIPEPLFLSFILILCILGSYGTRMNMVDVGVTCVVGVLGYLMKRASFPLPPVVIGLVLGQEFEQNIGQMILFKGGDSWLTYIFSSPIAVVLLGMVLFLIFLPLRGYLKKRRQLAKPVSE